MTEPIQIIVQRKKVTNTADGGSSLTFVASSDEKNKIQAAKIFLIPEDVNIKLTAEIIEDEDT